MFGYSPSEIIGRDIAVLYSPECAARKGEMIATLRRGQPIQHFEALCVHKDGRPIWVSLAIAPIGASGGTVSTASFTARDITERKALEEQLRQTAKLESIGVLAGGIAHDFNNLLVGILGNASLVRDTLPKQSASRPFLDDVIKASERAANLTQQLLAYSGRGQFVIQPVDLSALARDMVNLIQTSIPGGVRLQLNLDPALAPVVADVAQMQQLVMNLVINAAEAIGDRPGTVSITTRVRHMEGDHQIPAGNYVLLEVKDDGQGMDEATIAKIFDPFFTTKFTGRGLGLSATQGIVRGHKGLIRVESRLGEGSTFRVLLPAAAAETQPAGPAPETDHARGAAAGAILVIDDEEIVRRAAAGALEHRGYTVIMARDGQTGVDLCRKFAGRIALVVLDLNMPDMGGEECLRKLRAIDPDLPVILSSGFSEADTSRTVPAREATAFLQKPYTASRLAEAVQNALAAAVSKDRASHQSA
jgi:PAS domain S-box-containing protein